MRVHFLPLGAQIVCLLVAVACGARAVTVEYRDGYTFSRTEHEAKQQAVPTESAFVRLTPSTVLGLPAQVAEHLARQRYTIPHVVDTPPERNVVRGQFAKRGQEDVAVLASRDGYSEILVFWRGSVRAPAILARRRDDSIRAIHRADPKFIKDHHGWYGGPRPPSPLDHDGIDDGMMGKGSSVWYLFRGKWLSLTGAD